MATLPNLKNILSLSSVCIPSDLQCAHLCICPQAPVWCFENDRVNPGLANGRTARIGFHMTQDGGFCPNLPGWPAKLIDDVSDDHESECTGIVRMNLQKQKCSPFLLVLHSSNGS